MPTKTVPADGFHTTHKLKQILLLLQQLPGNSERIPLILGPAASGKSAVLRQLGRKAPSRWRLSHIQGSPDINGAGLLRQLARDWMPGKRVEKKSHLLAGLNELHRRGLLPVVLVDDAERLPQEALRLLLQLRQTAAEDGFYPILAADNSELDTLQRLSAGQELQLLYLSPWTAEEVAAYFKLEKNRPPTRAELERLLARTLGWPGRLLELLDDPSALHPSRFNLLLLVLLLVLLLASLFAVRMPLPELQRSAPQPAQSKASLPSSDAQSLTLGLPELELPAAEPPTSPAPVLEVALEGNSWLQQQSSAAYSLQLGHFTRLAELRAFAAKHRLDKGQPLAALKLGQGYLLIYGLYPDHRAAVRGRLLVPDTLHPDRIEVRRVRSLQKEIQ